MLVTMIIANPGAASSACLHRSALTSVPSWNPHNLSLGTFHISGSHPGPGAELGFVPRHRSSRVSALNSGTPPRERELARRGGGNSACESQYRDHESSSLLRDQCCRIQASGRLGRTVPGLVPSMGPGVRARGGTGAQVLPELESCSALV